jgi:aspartate-semialdehyde dehydrogenase
MKKPVTVAMVGATGAVGETLLEILGEREFPMKDFIPLASERSAGDSVSCAGRAYTVRNLADFDFKGVDIAFFSAGGSVSRDHAPRAAAAGAVVIDNTSHFRYDEDVPLVVSEVNPEAIRNRPRGIIANPNCSTMQLMVALKPIFDAAGIERINVATYQSVSGAGSFGTRRTGQADRQAVGTSSRPSEPKKLPGADRLQPDSAHRRLPRQRLHEGRDEAGLGNPQDPG